MTDHINENNLLDPELALLAGEIDKLALEDLPAGGSLESRIFDATLPVLRAAAAETANAPRLKLVGTAPAPRQRVGLSTGMRLAASLALLVTASAAWLANRPSAGTAVTQSPHDDWAVMTSLFDDNTTKELDQLATDAAGLDDRMKSINVGDLMLGEGAM